MNKDETLEIDSTDQFLCTGNNLTTHDLALNF